MRILTRYILKEIGSHALLGIGLFTFVIFMRDLGRIFDLIVRNSAPLSNAAEVFLYILPTTLIVTLPMGVLVGILVGLSRLAADSELTAMRASGIGVGLFIRAVSVFATGALLLGLFNSIYLAPKSAIALDRLQEKLKSSQASFEVHPRVFYEGFRNIVLYVQDVVPVRGQAIWRGIFLADISDPSAPNITLAERGALLADAPNKLRLHLEDGTQQSLVPSSKDQYSIATFDTTEIPIALPADNQLHDLLPVAELSLRELLRNAGQERKAAEAVRTSDPGSYSYDLIKARYYELEFHRRFALPTACLVLAMVGIPLGLSARKGGKSTGFVLTILLVIVYYFFSLIGVQLARQGRLSPWFGSWMGNIFFFACGVFLLWRVDRVPVEIGNFAAFWKALGQKVQAIFMHRGTRRAAHEPVPWSSRHRRRFSARFPLILDDVILRDFVLYLVMIMASFLMIALIGTLLELVADIMRNKVPLVTVAEYLWNLSPSAIYLTAPLAVLLAVLITFGLLERSSQLTAMKATGFSLYRATLPIVILSAVFAAGMFIFDQLYIPHTNREQEILRNQIKGRPAQTYQQADRKWIFGQSNEIYYYRWFDADQNTFGGISVFEFDPGTFQLTRRIQAERAQWEPQLKKWVFQQGWERRLHSSSIEDYRTFEVATFDELREEPGYFKKEVKESSEMNYQELRRYIDDLQQSGFDTVRLKVQLEKKLAFPVIALVMAVLAIPFAASGRRGGALVGVAVAVGIAVVYWATSGLFEAMGNANQLPALVAAWAPDFIFAMAGGYMLLRVRT